MAENLSLQLFPPNFQKVNDRAGALDTHFKRYRVDGFRHNRKFLNFPLTMINQVLQTADRWEIIWRENIVRLVPTSSVMFSHYSATCCHSLHKWWHGGEDQVVAEKNFAGLFSGFIHDC